MDDKQKKIATLLNSIETCKICINLYGGNDPKKYSYYAKRIENARRQLKLIFQK